MGASGGIALQQEYDLLQAELENFFGQQAEIRAGLKPEEPIYHKPPELLLYELVNSTGLPVWSGGLMDQPHIWLGYYRVVDNVYKAFEAIRRRNIEEAERQRREKNGATDS